jgi:hypothetical protein
MSYLITLLSPVCYNTSLMMTQKFFSFLIFLNFLLKFLLGYIVIFTYVLQYILLEFIPFIILYLSPTSLRTISIGFILFSYMI